MVSAVGSVRDRLRAAIPELRGGRVTQREAAHGLAQLHDRHALRLIPSRSLADSWGGFPGGHRYDSRWRSPVWRSPWLLPSRSAVTLMPPNSALWRSARGIPIRPAAFWLWRRSMMGPPGPRRLRSAA